MNQIVTVMAHGDGAANARKLAIGESATFGTCACGACEFDIVIGTAGGGHSIGRVTAAKDYWTLDNLGSLVPLVVQDLEESDHIITVPPNRLKVAIAFELAEVVAMARPIVVVFGPEPLLGKDKTPPCPAGEAIALNHDSTYFAVLVALCEPHLTGDGGALPPTSAEIAKRLNENGTRLSPRAVDAHITYLIGKLPIEPQSAGRHGHWRKQSLVRTAIRAGIVTKDDLARINATS
jgi:serine/threonine-protein kinase